MPKDVKVGKSWKKLAKVIRIWNNKSNENKIWESLRKLEKFEREKKTKLDCFVK